MTSSFSALVSFAYNVGLGAFKSSSVLKAVNAEEFGAVPQRLQLWVKAGGRHSPASSSAALPKQHFS